MAREVTGDDAEVERSSGWSEALRWLSGGWGTAWRGLGEVGAFLLITLAVMFKEGRRAQNVIGPMLRQEVVRACWRPMPMVLFLAGAFGFVVVSQMLLVLTRLNAREMFATIMVATVVREIGPLIAALVVLGREGNATVIEMGMARATGTVEALEALGIDPVHYLVVPRVIGMTVSVFTLTIYLTLGTLVAGYGVAFVNDVPLLPLQYFGGLAGALAWTDFVALLVKPCAFGLIIGVMTSFFGLAQPMDLREVSAASVHAARYSVVGCLCVDMLLAPIHWLV